MFSYHLLIVVEFNWFNLSLSLDLAIIYHPTTPTSITIR
jgi:hypothetical protein